MSTLIAILKLVPVIIALIQQLEDAIPLPGSGKARLDLILEVVRAIYDELADLQHEFTWERLAGVITKVVGIVVKVFNKTGVFSTSQP